MSTFDFENLANKYERFQHPKAIIKVNGKSLADEKKGFPVSDITIDLTSGFEASMAEFSIYDVFNKNNGNFEFDRVKKYIYLGSQVEVFLGYGPTVRSVFVGLITRVNFLFEEDGVPCIRVTAMDVKGIMMSSCYSRQLKALYYSDAVEEILEKTAYEKLKSSDIIRGVRITQTADKQRGITGGTGLGSSVPGLGNAASALDGVGSQVDTLTATVDSAASGLGGEAVSGMTDTVANSAGAVGNAASASSSAAGAAGQMADTATDAAGDVAGAASEVTVTDRSIEMVAESDYEFVVKAAKKNNYEFYTECGVVYFRKAKNDRTILMSIGPDRGLRSLDIAYDITGLVERVIARGTDAGKAKVISAKEKFSGKISKGSKAKAMIKGSQKVFIDASITSVEEAAERAQSLAETMSYRLGSLRCNTVGLPELHPGHFIEMNGLGTAADNVFYIDRVRHIMDQDGTYISELSGKASSIE